MASTRVPDDAPATEATRPRGDLVRRVFSLSGVVPLGAFLVAHTIANAAAVRGDDAFAATARAFERVPALVFLETLFVFAPLVAHTMIGLWLVIARRPLAHPSPYPRGVGVAVRATGVIAVAFLLMHLPELRFRAGASRLEGAELMTALTSDLSSTWRGVPWRGIAYLAAAGCVTFHFAAGLWGFVAVSLRDQFAGSRQLRRGTAWGAAAIGAALWIVLVNVVVLHATGARLLGDAAHEPATTEPCPPPKGP